MTEALKFRPKRWYGAIRDTKDPRDKTYSAPHIALPPTVDLRPYCPPVMDQGDLGSCTAHGITGALRYLIIKSGKADVPLSRLMLYFDERSIEATVNEDAGAEIRDGIKTLNKQGVAREQFWPYDIKKFKQKPPSAAYADAVAYQALSYERVSVSVTNVKTALAQGFPVVIGITLFDSFESDEVEKTGLVPMPKLHGEGMVGGHCMYCVGYGQKPNTFTVRNSWGPEWGDKGDCYMPEQLLGSPAFGADYWLVKTYG